ncbi:hypothetical protein L207DRAFT_233190 [Hyaloscypha variabilis F]|uniref:Transcription factor domain-containing protein n=1 Tax=Hyaloscypha variabilis (strain UAMH 11265 / GT02V1 / F) TaxID=1149755 RepID=A0A2J6QUP9_HYAVF|nr:hypothetical protein L207DRAFT_233190 [Hyaloscypha variabilis F]
MSRPKSEYKYNDLEFVNVTAPREHKNFAHQKAIKKHNMLRYWRGRNKGSCDSCRNRHLQPAQEATNCSREDENVHDDEDECSSLTIGDPHDRLGSGARNPFANYSIPATPYVDELLQYWLTHHLCDTFCTIEGAMKADNPAMDAFLLVVIRDPAMFHALLTVSSSLMDSSYGRKTPSTRTLEHMGSAITLVNESLNDSQQATRDRVLLTICLMTASHCIFKDYSNHELHVNGMHQIILLRGGIENIRASLLIYRIILWADQFRGLYTGTAPRYRVASSLSESPSTPPKPASKNTSLTLVDPEP